MFKLTTRELLVWMTLVAVSVTWWIDSRRGEKAVKENSELRQRLHDTESALEAAKIDLARQPWLRRPPPGPRRRE
jgi:hypothetical protein